MRKSAEPRLEKVFGLGAECGMSLLLFMGESIDWVCKSKIFLFPPPQKWTEKCWIVRQLQMICLGKGKNNLTKGCMSEIYIVFVVWEAKFSLPNLIIDYFPIQQKFNGPSFSFHMTDLTVQRTANLPLKKLKSFYGIAISIYVRSLRRNGIQLRPTSTWYRSALFQTTSTAAAMSDYDRGPNIWLADFKKLGSPDKKKLYNCLRFCWLARAISIGRNGERFNMTMNTRWVFAFKIWHPPFSTKTNAFQSANPQTVWGIRKFDKGRSKKPKPLYRVVCTSGSGS